MQSQEESKEGDKNESLKQVQEQLQKNLLPTDQQSLVGAQITLKEEVKSGDEEKPHLKVESAG